MSCCRSHGAGPQPKRASLLKEWRLDIVPAMAETTAIEPRLSDQQSRSKQQARLGVFGYRNFRLYFGGHSISLVGWSMHSVAQPWLVLILTDSPFYVGLVAMLGTLPILLFGLYGGVVADRFPKRRVLLVTQCAAMVTSLFLAAVVLMGVVTLAHVMIVATLLGVTAAFDIPGRQAFVADLVADRDMMSAIALNSASFNGSRIIGPAVAGVIIGVAGVGACFLLNGVSYLALIGALLVMRFAKVPGGMRETAARSTIREGLAYLFADRNMRTLLLLIAISSIFGLPFHVMLPVVARNVMGLGSTEFGWMVSATGAGAIVAALGLVTFARHVPKGRVITIAAPLFGLSVSSLGLAPSLAVLLPLLVLAGFFQVVLTATTNTLLQSMVKDEYRGRVMSAYSLSFLGLMPLGTLMAGIVAEGWGATAWLAESGIVCAALTLIALRSAPALRSLA